MAHIIQLTPRLIYFDRNAWGANESLPRLGELLDPTDAVEAIIHHTVGIDSDESPNYWETVAECYDRMRRYQTIRPDLGLDIPYSWLGFCMAAGFGGVPGPGTLLVMEGRGCHRRGAHTMFHNRTGRALSLAGNFEDFPADLAPWVPQISRFWGIVRDGSEATGSGLPRLGTVPNPRGWPVNGHKDFRREDDRRTWTACPGQAIMAAIDKVTVGLETEDIDMATADELRDEFKQGDEDTRRWLMALAEVIQANGVDILNLRNATDFLIQVVLRHEASIQALQDGAPIDAATWAQRIKKNEELIEGAQAQTEAITERLQAFAAAIEAAAKQASD